MATDGPTPPPCDPEISKNGTTVLVTHSVPSNATERWVKKVAALSGQRVDWSFVGGAIVVQALGDLDKVIVAMRELKMEWAYLYRKHLPKSLAHGEFDPRSVPWMEKYALQEVTVILQE